MFTYQTQTNQNKGGNTMFTNKRLSAILLALLVVVVAVSGCIPGGAGRRMDEVRKHWNAGVAIENEGEAKFAVTVQDTNEGFQYLKSAYPLIGECYSNSDEVIKNAVSGRYDNNVGENEAPSGEVNGLAIGQALVVNEAYPGDITECQQMASRLIEDLKIWRQKRSNNFRELWEIKRRLDTHYQGDLYRSLAVDLLQFAQEEATKLGVPIPQYVYPTFHLEVVSRDEEICSYYRAEWNTALNQCTLNGKGAYEYMFRPFVAAEVQDSFDSGEDNLNPFEDAPKP
jgi:hypothetical protein